jgi:hypothetical protein
MSCPKDIYDSHVKCQELGEGTITTNVTVLDLTLLTARAGLLGHQANALTLKYCNWYNLYIYQGM